MKKNIHFVDEINSIKISPDSKLFKIDLSFCDTKDNLFKYFAKELNFPDYFGHNWDAFDECIHDFGWLKDSAGKTKVYVYMYNLADILKKAALEDKKIFFKIINKEDIYIDEFNNPVQISFLFNKSEENYYHE